MAKAEVKNDYTWKEKASEYFTNNGPKAVFISIWLGGNIAFFAWRYYTYQHSKYYKYMTYGITFAKASAACLSFNSALMLVTMLRNFLSAIRSSFLGSLIPVDKNIVFHRYMGWAIAFFAAIHIVAHFFNYHALGTSPA